MARGGHFKPNPLGYRAIMNGTEVMEACEAQGQQMAARASAGTGVTYTVDSRPGLNRIHTRVSGPPARDVAGNWNSDWFRFRRQMVSDLAITVGSSVNPAVYRSLGQSVSRVSSLGKSASVHRKANRGWKAIAGGYRKAR